MCRRITLKPHSPVSCGTTLSVTFTCTSVSKGGDYIVEHALIMWCEVIIQRVKLTHVGTSYVINENIDTDVTWTMCHVILLIDLFMCNLIQ